SCPDMLRRELTSSLIPPRRRRVSNIRHHPATGIFGRRAIGSGPVAFSTGPRAPGYPNAVDAGSRTIGIRPEISGTSSGVIGSRNLRLPAHVSTHESLGHQQ